MTRCVPCSIFGAGTELHSGTGRAIHRIFHTRAGVRGVAKPRGDGLRKHCLEARLGPLSAAWSSYAEWLYAAWAE